MSEFPPQFYTQWAGYRERVEGALSERLKPSASATSAVLYEAMGYACLDGGKRFRAMLVYACGELAGAALAALDTPASAVEMVHAYSLVHDDLPSMDDDRMRRGKATCHIAYDEATAVLAGDALQSRAFEILASYGWNPIAAENRCRMVEELAAAIGMQGMAAGQCLDMQASGHSIDVRRVSKESVSAERIDAEPISAGRVSKKQVALAQLQQIHQLKTGELIRASAVLGCLAGEFDENQLACVSQYAADLGHAFQIADDILDAVADSQTLGKISGADKRQDKATYVALLGLDQARLCARRLSDKAIDTIGGLGDNSAFLQTLAKFVISRSY